MTLEEWMPTSLSGATAPRASVLMAIIASAINIPKIELKYLPMKISLV